MCSQPQIDPGDDVSELSLVVKLTQIGECVPLFPLQDNAHRPTHVQPLVLLVAAASVGKPSSRLYPSLSWWVGPLSWRALLGGDCKFEMLYVKSGIVFFRHA